MVQSFYKKGAEAELREITFEGRKALSKKRVPKGYRNTKLDDAIRSKRTRAEAKLFKQASCAIRVPRVFSVDDKECEIVMEFVEGKILKEVVEKERELCVEAGREIRKLHDLGIIHGDLTTSNIILIDEKTIKKENKDLNEKNKSKLCFIDFGLGFFSDKLEDRATDPIVFKKTFNATHSSLKNGWELVINGYNPGEEMKERMREIEKRARYH